MSTKKQLPATFAKKLAIAQRIFEPMNDKRFQFVAQEDGTFKLSGLEESNIVASYREVASEDGKQAKGFSVMKGNKSLLENKTTLDVGQFLRPIKATIMEIFAPVVEAPIEEEVAPKAKAAKKVKATAEA